MSKESTQQVSLSAEALQEILKTTIVTAVQELKKPSAEEQAKLDAAKKAQEQRDAEMLEAARAEEQAKYDRQARCGHKKENGKWATGGQIFNDGYVRIMCTHCQKMVKFRPTNEMLNGQPDFQGWPLTELKTSELVGA